MDPMIVRPSRSYANKQRVACTIIAFLFIFVGFWFGQLIGIDEGQDAAMTVFFVVLVVGSLFWIVSMFVAGIYAKSLSYEIQDDEVIVRVGIITKSVKHVPYRTVTNISIKRGLLDRYLFNMGTLNIQTAGMSGNTGAEESLVGLADFQKIYDIVVDKLRLFRGAMGPTAAGSDEDGSIGGRDVFADILSELKAIRENTER